MDELEKALELAPKEEDLGRAVIDDAECTCGDDLSPEFIERIAEDALQYASDKCSDPLVHKVMSMMIIQRMVQWHTLMALAQFEEGNNDSGTCWMRDAGKFQSMLDSLVNITVGPDDFTCTQDDD